MYSKNQKKTPEKLIDAISELSEHSGFNCIGPITSHMDGEDVSAHFSRLNSKDTNFCFDFENSFSNALDKITENNPEVEDVHIRASLQVVSETAMSKGACRFWKSFGSTVPSECRTANEDYIKAKKDALSTYNGFNNRY